MIKSITKIILLIFFFLLIWKFNVITSSICKIALVDGWNGASVDVDINGVPVTSFGFTNGNNSTDSVFTLNGDIVELRLVSQNWDTEITFQVYNPSVQILNMGSLLLIMVMMAFFINRYF